MSPLSVLAEGLDASPCPLGVAGDTPQHHGDE
uniref:Uncharacterized protein n=1 Tax=Arundo donax TaxID=35708 RepID=A0A0A9C551_ARUDO